MPFISSVSSLQDGARHEEAPESIISMSWAFLFLPCLFIIVVFVWIAINFSQPSEFPEENGYHPAETEDEVAESDEKDQLLNPFQENQSHSRTRNQSSNDSDLNSEKRYSSSSWKISGKFSSTSRGSSIYTTYPDPNASPKSSISSPKSKRASLTIDGKPIKPVGSKAAKAQAVQRDRMMQDLEAADREELQRSSSIASSTRKSD